MSDTSFRHRRAIIKADDFGRGPLIDPWRRFYDVCSEFDTSPSIGIVGSDFGQNDRLQALAKYFFDSFNVEFWNHSYTHKDMRQLTSEERQADTIKAQDVIGSVLGLSPSFYGAPFNYVDNATLEDVAASYPFKGVYFKDNDGKTFGSIGRNFLLSPEVSTQFFRPILYDFFAENYDRRTLPACLVLQVHPTYWSDECYSEFRRILRRLKVDQYQIMNASEFLDSQLDIMSFPASELNVGSMVSVSEAIYNDAASDAQLASVMTDSDRKYYFGRLRRGTASITRFLQRNGLVPSERGVSKWSFLDVGAGIGNWALAAAAGHPAVSATAVDINEVLLNYMEMTLPAYLGRSRCKFVTSSIASLPVETDLVDGLACNNALNYMPVDKALAEISRVCRPNGIAYIGLQNELYPILDLLRCLQVRDFEGALNRIDRFVWNEARRCGVVGGGGFIHYWNDQELERIVHYAGLQPLLRGMTPPEEYGELLGIPVLWGYLLTRTAPSRQRGKRLLAGEGATPDDLEALIASGATDFAWKLVSSTPGLAANQKAFVGLLKQVALKNDMTPDQVINLAEGLAIPLQSSDCEDVRTVLPLTRQRGWEQVSSFYHEKGAAEKAVCASWIAARVNRVALRHDLACNGLLHPLSKLGRTIIEDDHEGILAGVQSLFSALGSRPRVMGYLVGADPKVAVSLIDRERNSDLDVCAAEAAHWSTLLSKTLLIR